MKLNSEENEKEIRGLMLLFKSLDEKRLIFWLPPAVDVRANEVVRAHQLLTILRRGSDQIETDIPEKERLCNMSYEEIAAFYNPFIQYYLGEENKPSDYSGDIHLDDYLMASRQLQSYLDCMHLYKNAAKSFWTHYLRGLSVDSGRLSLIKSSFTSVVVLNCPLTVSLSLL